MRDIRYAALFVLIAVFFTAAVFSGNRPAGPSDAADDTRSRPSSPFPGLPVNVNAAGIEELTAVPGIGVKTAERIVARRLEVGGFSSVDDLLAVKYMSRAKLDRMRALVSVK